MQMVVLCAIMYAKRVRDDNQVCCGIALLLPACSQCDNSNVHK